MTKKSNKKEDIKGLRKPIDLSNKTLTIVFPTYWCINDKVHENYGGLEPRTFAVAKLFADEGCTVNILAPRGSETKHKNINVLSGTFRAWDGKNPHPYDLEKDLVLSNLDVIKKSDVYLEDDHFHYLTYLKSKNPDDFPIGAFSMDHHPDVLDSLPLYPQNIICVSKWQMSVLREKFRHLNHRFYQAYSGLVLENYPTDFDSKDKQDNLYLYLARFSSVKAPHLVINLAEENPLDDFVCLGDTLFAGEYQYIRKVKEAADELDNVKIIFNCSYKEKIEYLRKSVGLLHPGFWLEPLGLDMLEGLYFGNKVYAFDRGGPREIYKPQDHGLIIPWGPNQEENAELYLKNFKTFKGLKTDPNVCRERVIKNFDFKKISFPVYKDVLFGNSK